VSLAFVGVVAMLLGLVGAAESLRHSDPRSPFGAVSRWLGIDERPAVARPIPTFDPICCCYREDVRAKREFIARLRESERRAGCYDPALPP
jgi:hypothetical protein